MDGRTLLGALIRFLGFGGAVLQLLQVASVGDRAGRDRPGGGQAADGARHGEGGGRTGAGPAPVLPDPAGPRRSDPAAAATRSPSGPTRPARVAAPRRWPTRRPPSLPRPSAPPPPRRPPTAEASAPAKQPVERRPRPLSLRPSRGRVARSRRPCATPAPSRKRRRRPISRRRISARACLRAPIRGGIVHETAFSAVWLDEPAFAARLTPPAGVGRSSPSCASSLLRRSSSPSPWECRDERSQNWLPVKGAEGMNTRARPTPTCRKARTSVRFPRKGSSAP